MPAYQGLWSRHDEINHHRRYSCRALVDAAAAAGWSCERTTHFNSLLLPVAIALRAVQPLNRSGRESSLDLWIPPAPLNWLLEQPLNLEAALIGRGVADPGGAVVAGFVSLRRDGQGRWMGRCLRLFLYLFL